MCEGVSDDSAHPFAHTSPAPEEQKTGPLPLGPPGPHRPATAPEWIRLPRGLFVCEGPSNNPAPGGEVCTARPTAARTAETAAAKMVWRSAFMRSGVAVSSGGDGSDVNQELKPRTVSVPPGNLVVRESVCRAVVLPRPRGHRAQEAFRHGWPARVPPVELPGTRHRLSVRGPRSRGAGTVGAKCPRRGPEAPPDRPLPTPCYPAHELRARP